DIDNGALNISAKEAPGQWYSAMSDTIDKMQTVELGVARNVVARAQVLQRAAEQLPERVRQLGETPDSATSLEVSPIDVLSVDEIGQVARAFDQVHSEAVRLAGNEALLRRSFNAMFVSLSRRSQSLIERLVRM